jgi:nicotinamide riboside transporter PnuC
MQGRYRSPVGSTKKEKKMEGVMSMLQSLPWWDTFTTVVVIASGITATLQDRYAEKIPIIGKIWPIMNWLSLNVGHNENNRDGVIPKG